MLKQRVYKTVLDNGLTVLVLPKHNIPKVSLQLWYNVGSKDEQTGEKGIAHLIEHMIFKGTGCLTESDINMIVHRLSGYCNAFTSYDYTGYLFDVPSQHWHEIFPIMADCMRNCTFKEQLLNSELKAVIQELKMYNDDYVSTLLERMIAAIFPDHPYHHPIIGYKQDLWSLKRDALVNFYYRHYIPNNATLVAVGDVHLEDIFEMAEKHFGGIPADLDYRKEEFYHSPDLTSNSIAIYRDVQLPFYILSWVIPGTKARKDYVFDLLSWIIGSGKGSRLYTKLVDELGLATELESFVHDLFDYGLFCIYFQPEKVENVEKIIELIKQELHDLVTKGIAEQEITRARKKTEVDFLTLTENNQKLAYLLGKFYLATGQEDYLITYTEYPHENIQEELQQIIKHYLRPSVMYRGSMLPLPPSEKEYWLQLQQQSDAEDSRILAGITREAAVECAAFAHSIVVKKPHAFNFPKPTAATLKNGLKVLFCHNPHAPKIDLILDFKAKQYYDPIELQGLSLFTADMLQEGTQQHSASELAQLLESRGMEFNTAPGQLSMSMLSSDASVGFKLLCEVLTESSFETNAIEKVRTQILGELKNFWDTPVQSINQLVRQAIYKDHPYAKNPLGTPESVQRITREDLLQAYRSYITPQEARIAIVGDLGHYDIPALLEETLGSWQGQKPPVVQFPAIDPIIAKSFDHYINRDQVVLCFGGLSVSRHDPLYDKILLFDQIFSGGVLGSMSSRLFELRERSGIFYTIAGSLLAGVSHQPGLVMVKTIVSNDRLEEAEKEIARVIDEGAQRLSPVELEEAQLALINSLVDHFATNKNMASAFLFVDEYNFASDYFDKRAEQLLRIPLQEVQEAAAQIMNSKKMVKVRMGRI